MYCTTQLGNLGNFDHKIVLKKEVRPESVYARGQTNYVTHKCRLRQHSAKALWLRLPSSLCHNQQTRAIYFNLQNESSNSLPFILLLNLEALGCHVSFINGSIQRRTHCDFQLPTVFFSITSFFCPWSLPTFLFMVSYKIQKKNQPPTAMLDLWAAIK